MTKTFYITTPIYYVNDVPHIGHAYTSLAADFLARAKRLDGYKVKFLTGTDEHGQKVQAAAEKRNLAPQVFVDEVAQSFIQMGRDLNLSNDDFIRTSEDRHKQKVVEVWNTLFAKGEIYEGKYAGWYSVRDETFYQEAELVNGKAPTGAEVAWVEEPSYFFKLSKWGDALLAHIEANPDFIMPEAKRSEVISFIKQGLTDLSVSRTSFSWGIPVPQNQKHVMYVWVDALTNYLSAVEGEGFWPADLHIVGKDILRFHAIIWPAMLMACGVALPKRVFAHGWWLVEGEKMSKSIGNVISPKELVAKYGLDYVRYFLLREMPFGNDGNFAHEQLVNRVNSELVNNIGNLCQRVLAFVFKNCDATIKFTNLLERDNLLLERAYNSLAKFRKHLDLQEIHFCLDEIVQLGRAANEYIDAEAPWVLKKTDINRMNDVLYTLCEAIRVIAILLQTIVPEGAMKLLSVLNIKNATLADISRSSSIANNHIINEPLGLFPRL